MWNNGTNDHDFTDEVRKWLFEIQHNINLTKHICSPNFVLINTTQLNQLTQMSNRNILKFSCFLFTPGSCIFSGAIKDNLIPRP